MDKLREAAKLFEDISAKNDPHFDSAAKAIQIVKEFARRKKLIIYGGTAIDFALRIHGDNIYPDESLLIPDLDFYSPQNVDDAYELADLLYDAGFPEARTIKATHMRTMRVDIIENHFIADLSFIEPKIFEKLPFIEYEGMRVIHPNYQKIDLHSSLNFPFDNPPKEVIFARWKKDIYRYNKISEYYPTNCQPGKTQMKKISFSIYEDDSTGNISNGSISNGSISNGSISNGYVLDGFIAYSLIYFAYADLRDRYSLPDFDEKTIYICPDVEISPGKIVTDILSEMPDIVNYISAKIPEDIPENAKYYSRYLEIIPKYISYEISGVQYEIKIIDKRLLSCYVISAEDVDMRVVGIQYLLLQFLLMSYIDTGRQESYIKYYCSLLAIIENAEAIISGIPDEEKRNNIILNSPFFPTVNTWGKCNMSETYESGLINTLKNVIDGDRQEKTAKCSDKITIVLEEMKKYSELVKMPTNYYPGRGKTKTPFNYEESIYYIRDQREISKDIFPYI